MQSFGSIQYLSRQELDIRKWDHCIATSINGLPYAYSIYLDHMAKQWGALVLNDYEAVMPLTFNTKYCISYMYQPAFVAQLGIFGHQIKAALVEAFLAAIPKKFRLIEIELNQANPLPANPQLSKYFNLRSNYVLNLHAPYEDLYSQYRDNIRRNIKKAQQLDNRYQTNIPIAAVMELSRSQMQGISNLTDLDYRNFEALFNALQKENKAMACGVYSASDQLIASCAYVISNGRACYILVGNHPNGRTSGASHFLIDRFIHQHAGQPLVLDFEGSDIRNLAFFYSSFGATLETYPSLRINRLPWPLGILKTPAGKRTGAGE
ncbi:MAG: GNAT family N-acetyltransferase [Chitinophagaceae bacterium]|nr:GNAT family N-acetyltransferase [Chitinophagaceae bacterium]